MNKGILSGLAAAVIWGLANVWAKGLVARFEPLSFFLAELSLSTILLWVFLFAQKRSGLLKPEVLKYGLVGFIQPGLAFIFGVYGLYFTTANSDSLIWTAECIVIIFLSWLILRERIGWTILILAISGTVGTILATAPQPNSEQASCMILGNLLIAVGVFFAALYSVLTQQQLIKIEPLHLTALHQVFGLVLVIAVWLIGIPFLHPFDKGTTLLDCINAAFCGVAQFALPFWLYLKAIKNLGAANTSIFLVLPPVFTIIGSFFFLGERLNAVQWLGAILALMAVGGICVFRPEDTPASNLLTE